MEKKSKKAKRLSGQAIQIAEKRREEKSKGEKKAKMVRLTSLNCSTVVRKVWKVG